MSTENKLKASLEGLCLMISQAFFPLTSLVLFLVWLFCPLFVCFSFMLLCYVSFYYCVLGACLFSKERQTGSGSGGEELGEVQDGKL